MSILVDLILVAIVGFSARRGFKNGIILGLCAILAITVSVYTANILSTVYSREFTGMLKPFISGVVDKSVSSTLDGAIDRDSVVIELSEEEKSDVYSVSFASMRNLGLSDSASKQIADDADLKTDIVGQTMSDTITNKLCTNLAYIAIFSVVFVLIIIIFSVAGNLVNLTFAIPGHDKIDKYTGMALGIVKGILILLIIACVFRYAGIILLKNSVENSILLKWLINSNLIADLLGI